ncbi:MAG: RDD family protein [Planctomycetes bacterium]|nr:RDD family protein [Planctomycetota bacterium]
MASLDGLPAVVNPTGPPIYRREDYVGGVRHFVIFVVDGAVILLFLLPLTSIIAILAGQVTGATGLFIPWLPLLCIWAYLAVLKPSRYGSLGYWATDAKIVTIHGHQPSPFRMTLRLVWALFWWFRPLGFIIDLFWIPANRERQMLRDLFAETRLIRRRAKPIGVGKTTYVMMTSLNIAVLYAEIRERRETGWADGKRTSQTKLERVNVARE